MRKSLESRRRKLWKRGITALLAFCLVSVWVLAGTFTSFAQEGTITASSAKIRREASTSSEAIGSALSGQKVTINSTTQGSDGKTWYQVTVNGMTGYIRSDLLRADGDNSSTGGSTGSSTPVMNPTVAVTALTPQTATVATGTAGVRVRTDASTASSIITSLQNNAAITILGQATGADGNVWYQVSFSLNGAETQGFIRNDYVKLPDGVTLTPQDSDPTVDPSAETPSEDSTDTGEDSRQPDQSDSKEYDTQLKANSTTGEDTWYLLDYANNKQYPIADLIAAGTGNAAYLQKMESKVTTQKIIILVLVVIIIAAALAITLLYFKLRDADDAYYAAVEKQTIRDRNAAKAQGGRASSDRVMQTVGSTGRQERGTAQNSSAGTRPAGARPVQGSSQTVQRPAGGTRPVQGNGQMTQRPAGSTRPVQGNGQMTQRPAGTRPVQGNGQMTQRPAGARPVQGSSQTAQRPTGTGRPVQGESQTTQRLTETVRPAQTTQGNTQTAPNRTQTAAARPTASQEQVRTQSRRPQTASDDDEFEFEFLNWDGEESK